MIDAQAAPLASPAAVSRATGRRRQRRREPADRSAWALPVALACLGLALYLAAIHPLGARWAVPAVLAVLVLARYFWTVWPGWMLALVPCLGLAPWTGWLWLEEWDVLVLASAAGGYLAWSGPHRHAPPPVQPVWRRALRWRGAAWGLMGLAAAMAGLSVGQGVSDAGGLDWWVWQGYSEAGQALRAGKPVLALALMLPLWHRAAVRAPQTLTPALSAGLCGVLLVVSVGAVLERWAYTGLSNFSSDYRTTSVFWEMHVGGAALDGALALSLPFGLLALLRARRRGAVALAWALLLLGLYATLTTFSRGLYLAAVLALPLTLALWWRQQRGLEPDRFEPFPAPGRVLPLETPAVWPGWASLQALLVLVAVGAAVGWQVFGAGGYRGLLAVAGALVALLLQPPSDPALGRRGRAIAWGLGLAMAVPVVALGALAAGVWGKLAYLIYALAWAVSVLLARAAWNASPPWRTALGDSLRAAAWLSTVGMAGVVVGQWGGWVAALPTVGPLMLLALVWPLTQGGRLGDGLARLGWRARMAGMAAVLAAAGLIAALAGGGYIAGRMSTVSDDMAGRLHHWSRGVTMTGAAGGKWFGVGAGRYAAHFADNAPLDERVGDMRLLGGPEPALALAAGRHVQGWGEMFRLLQRVDDAPPGMVLRARVRNPVALTLHAEVCERHLLYTAACRTAQAELPASGAYRWVTLTLGGDGELAAGVGPRRELAFALAVATPGTRVDVAQLSLQGRDGRELLRNGGFDEGLARWFFTSDRHHLPWHAKSLLLHWYFEQGALGVLVGLTLWGVALARVSWGHAAAHPLAPALAGALLGFMLVGLFDSLVDAARLAFLYGTLVMLGLGLRSPPPPAPEPTGSRV